MIVLDTASKTPLHIQLYEALKHAITHEMQTGINSPLSEK
jgi:hypothetical protein